jgi:hypothetical protein
MFRNASLLAAALLLLRAGAGSAQSAPTVAQVGWIAGCWELSSGARLIEEQWMRPRGGLMLGVSRTVAGDSLREYEQVALFERGGRLVYAAAPARQAPAEFESTRTRRSRSKSGATFRSASSTAGAAPTRWWRGSKACVAASCAGGTFRTGARRVHDASVTTLSGGCT